MKLNNVFKIAIITLCIQLNLSIKKDQTVFELFSTMGSNNMQAPVATPPVTTPPTPVPAAVPAATPTPAPAATNSTLPVNPNVVDLNDPNAQLADWLSIASYKLRDNSVYPTVNTRDSEPQKILFGDLDQTLNLKYEQAQKEGAKYIGELWFRARGGYIYYSATKDDINVIGAVYAKNATDVPAPIDTYNATFYCFNVFDFEQAEHKVCSMDQKTKYKWMCSIQAYTKQPLDLYCIPEDQRHAKVDVKNVDIKTITQPLIIIPTPSRNCNAGWDYKQAGQNWECECKEGTSQSPIDLPIKDSGYLSSKRPSFNYDVVNAKPDFSTIDGLITAGEYIKIRYDRGALRIFHPNLGKIVQEDGAVFQAEEISFHTPSEHTINGEQFDMEMQIIHTGRTKGDIAKQAIFSFLFKKKPGVYNKFIDRLDFFNLPNPTELFRDITKDIYIPAIFSKSEDDDINFMKPFSFYTYEGSITTPPCSERTTHYVAADPIPLSNTVIQLFREALRIPDATNDNGDIIVNTADSLNNNRAVQPLNGRKVYIYDHIKFHCPDYSEKPKNVQPVGHYEKAINTVTDYVYVSGKKPSGLPDSFVVTEAEAKGLQQQVDNLNNAGAQFFTGE
jgi:carbonic anhydrase